MIAQGKHSQAPEVLSVKVLGRFVDIFLTVVIQNKHLDPFIVV